MLCLIWHHMYNLKDVKNTHGRVFSLVKLKASACNFTKSNTPPWVFFTIFKLYKWYQIVPSVSLNLKTEHYVVDLVSRKKLSIVAINFSIYTCPSFTPKNFSYIYLFKVDNRHNRKGCETCSKVKIKTPERRN